MQHGTCSHCGMHDDVDTCLDCGALVCVQHGRPEPDRGVMCWDCWDAWFTAPLPGQAALL